MLESLFNKVYSKDTKEAPTQVFSCEYCKIFKNTFFTEHLRWLLLLWLSAYSRSSRPDVLWENFAKTGRHLCQRLFLMKLQVFSCEFCKISKSTFSYRTPPVAASVTPATLLSYDTITSFYIWKQELKKLESV